MFKINIDNFKKTFISTFIRVPVAMFISIVTFILWLVKIGYENIGYGIENLIDKGILTLSLMFFFSIAIYFFSESKKISNKQKWNYQAITLVFGALYYSFFEENLFLNMYAETLVYIILTFLGVFAFMFFSPFILSFIKKKSSQDDFYIFSYSLVIKVLMSVIAGVATMLLGFIALRAVFSLFNLDTIINEGKMFGRWASFSLSLFAPIFFLANLPSSQLSQKEGIVDNKFYSFLINYISLPAIIIYFLILYSYTVKVIVNFSKWPNGEIAWMVIGFSIFGYLIYFASYVFEEKFKIVKTFRNIFPVAVLLQTFMLFYAIFLRIRQYDITINRYFVVVFGFWLLGLSLYFIFSKKKYLGTIFYSLLLLIIFISIGPWSVYVLPEHRQQSRLRSYLIEAQILKDGQIIPLEKYDDISAKLSGQIYGSIQYLCNYHGCDTLNSLFSKEISEIKAKDIENFKNKKKRDIKVISASKRSQAEKDKNITRIESRKYQEPRSWSIIERLTEKIKIQAYNQDRAEDKAFVPKYFKYRIKYEQRDNFNLNIENYDYLLELKSGNLFNYLKEKTANKEVYHAIIDIENEELLVYYGGLRDIIEDLEINKLSKNNSKFLVEKFSLNGKFKEILTKHNPEKTTDGNKENLIDLDDIEDLSFDLTGEKIDVRVQLNEISIKNPKWTLENNINDELSMDTDTFLEKSMTMMLAHNLTSGIILIREKK